MSATPQLTTLKKNNSCGGWRHLKWFQGSPIFLICHWEIGLREGWGLRLHLNPWNLQLEDYKDSSVFIEWELSTISERLLIFQFHVGSGEGEKNSSRTLKVHFLPVSLELWLYFGATWCPRWNIAASFLSWEHWTAAQHLGWGKLPSSRVESLWGLGNRKEEGERENAAPGRPHGHPFLCR